MATEINTRGVAIPSFYDKDGQEGRFAAEYFYNALRPEKQDVENIYKGINAKKEIGGAMASPSPQGGGGDFSALSQNEAIRKRALKPYLQNFNTEKKMAKMEAPIQRFQRTMEATQVADQMKKIIDQKYMQMEEERFRREQMEAQKDAQRNNIVGGIVGTIGSVVGGLF